MTAPSVAEIVKAIDALYEKATPPESLTISRYEQGGGRVFVDGKSGERQLVADFYDEANRELWIALHANYRALRSSLAAPGGDESIGDVIAAYGDGTIVLDDGLSTVNHRRACMFLSAERDAFAKQLRVASPARAESEREAGFNEGVEAAAKWHDNEARIQREYVALECADKRGVTWREIADDFELRAARHAVAASSIRALKRVQEAKDRHAK